MARRKLALALAALALAAGAVALAAPAHAAGAAVSAPAAAPGSYQYQSNFGYANAWSGGPYIDNYSNPAVNNDFLLNPNGSYDVLVLANGGGYNGYCISSAGNQAGDHTAALNKCTAGGTGGGTPWGANFTAHACDGSAGIAFQNVNSGGWLAPTGSGNGLSWTLDGGFSCLVLHAPA